MPKQTKKYKKSFSYISSMFLDSGAFTLSRNISEKDRENFYKSKDFFDYMNAYASYVKKYKIAIDLCANVDVIGDAELTWRNQQYLEKRKIHPVPVVHLGTDLRWLRMYIDKKYKMIALGGLAGSLDFAAKRNWLDKAFNIICNTPDRLPKVKIHGFGVLVFKFLFRYPFWSVDSTTWSQTAAYGGITVPHFRKGYFDFRIKPYLVKISNEGIPIEKNKHYIAYSLEEKKIIKKWLKFIKIPMGEINKKGEITEEGVSNANKFRNSANILYLEELKKQIPEWPWAFLQKERKSLI